MRLTIFSRVMIAQGVIIALVGAVSLFAQMKLHLLTQLNTDILTIDSASINEEKRLLKAFFAEMRNAEKYLLAYDQGFMSAFATSSLDFNDALAKVSSLVDTEREKDLVKEIGILHAIYGENLSAHETSGALLSSQAKGKISEGIIEKVNELIKIREQSASAKTAAARDEAATAAEWMFWMTMAGIASGLFFAYMHARSVSTPLVQLAKEMEIVGRGEFSRSIELKGPKEVRSLAGAFNRMAEELAHLDRLKADFTAHVSHELRTPLTAIREGSALLLEEIPGPVTKAQREILEIVQNHSERLFQSISSILDLSRMQAEMMEYEFTACDLNTVIANSVQPVELIARNRGISLSVDTDAPLPMINADERRIGQVLDNLLSNAIKFTPQGGSILVRASHGRKRDGDAAEIEVAVSDTGSGIPDEEIQYIFEHYYQCANNRKRGQQGAGLGLAIARHIIEAHRGHIWAENRREGGTVFFFTIPVTTSTGEFKSCSTFPRLGEDKC